MVEPDKTDDPHEETPYFCFSASIRVFGDGVDIDGLTHQLRLEPTHQHRKGERRSAVALPWENDMWCYRAPVGEAEPLEDHIMALWNAIRPNIAYLRGLKDRYRVDVFCGYRSNSDTAGFEVGHHCLGLFAELEVPFGVSVIIA